MSHSKPLLIYPLLASMLILFVYHQINTLGFAYVDDAWMLLDEPLVRYHGFDINFVMKVFSRINSLQYSPLNTFYYHLVYQINGYDAYWYHLGSFIIHICNIVVLFFLTRRLLEVFDVDNAVILAYSVSLLWAILPFNVESVVWISASKIPLFSFFGMLSVLSFINAVLKKSNKFYVLSLFYFAISFLAKEQAVLIALVNFSFICCYQLKIKKLDFKANIKYCIPFFILSGVFGLITLYAGIYGGGSHDVIRYPFSQRLVLSFYCIFFYSSNLFLPMDLHYHYPFPMGAKQNLPIKFFVYPFITSLILIQLYILISKSRYFTFYIFCVTVFFAHLLLCIQVFPLARAAIVADRYMYQSSIGLIMICVVAAGGKLNFEKITAKGIMIIALYIGYVAYFTIYSNSLVIKWLSMNIIS